MDYQKAGVNVTPLHREDFVNSIVQRVSGKRVVSEVAGGSSL